MATGIVLLAFGSPCYAHAAYNMATSIKHFDKDIPICLLRDDVAFSKGRYDHSVFDMEIKLSETDTNNPARIKTDIYKYLPFDYNLYLDVDGCAMQSCRPLIERLLTEDKSYAVYVVEKYDKNSPEEMPQMIWAHKSTIWNHYQLNGHVLPATQSSIQWIKKCSETENLFDKLKENLANPIPVTELRYQWGGSQPDELYLNVTLAQLGLLPHIGNDAIFFGFNLDKRALSKIKAEHYFLSVYGGRGFTKAPYVEFYDRLMHNYFKEVGKNHVYKSNYLYQGKHSDKRGVITTRTGKKSAVKEPETVKEIPVAVKPKVSLAITNYNRVDMLIESFEKIIDDERIDEIIISDDCSDIETYEQLQKVFEGKEKINLHRNETNIGMAKNKYHAVELCNNEWVILFDSDNVLDKNYLDKLFQHEWKADVIYMPDGALPNFNYASFSGKIIDRTNIKAIIDRPMFDCLLNTCNYFFNRDNYLNTYVHDDSIKETDTIHFNYQWLKAGKQLQVVPGMNYRHRVHDASGFMQNAEYNFKKAEEIKNLIRDFKSFKGKVTCNLVGRLGNQMFQIAATIGYARRYEMEYIIPEKSLDPNVWQNYFRFPASDFKAERTIKQSGHHYQQLPFYKSICLDGYFQSEKFFLHCIDEVRDVFRIPTETVKGKVGIHVRRGDYIIHPHLFPVLPESYYLQAIKHFVDKGNAEFIVFSDDIAWCREQFTKEKYFNADFTFSDGDEFDDFYLLSKCEHGIIANSSFSLMAMILNRNPDKIVIAPHQSKWYGTGNRHLLTRDIIPHKWIQIRY